MSISEFREIAVFSRGVIAVTDHVAHVPFAGIPAEVFRGVVGDYAILMAAFHSFGTRAVVEFADPAVLE